MRQGKCQPETGHALGVPVKLVIYAGEGHQVHKLTDLEDLRGRILAGSIIISGR